MTSPRLFSSPSTCRAGNLLGTTRTRQPRSLALVWRSRYAMISPGVLTSLPSQKGQKALPVGDGSFLTAMGLLARSGAMITQRPTIGSLRSSDMLLFLGHQGQVRTGTHLPMCPGLFVTTAARTSAACAATKTSESSADAP